jgi:hypothetical protein
LPVSRDEPSADGQEAEAPAGVFREAGRWGIKSRQGVRETCRPAAGVPVSSVTLPRFP